MNGTAEEKKTKIHHKKQIMIRNFRPAAGFLIDDDNEKKNDNANKTTTTTTTSTVYRCGSTDILGDKNTHNWKINTGDTDAAAATDTIDYGDAIVFHQAGLILDLRSPSERNEKDAHRWMEKASSASASAATTSDSQRSTTTTSTTTPQTSHRRRQQPRPIHILQVPTTSASTIEEEWFEMNFTTEEDDDDDARPRYVIQLDLLNRTELVQYIQTTWLVPPKTTSMNTTNELNKRGLAGLNEAILETKTGQTGLCRALQIMTLYREAVIRNTKKRNIQRNHDSTHRQQQSNDDNDDSDATSSNDSSSIVIHCVQGKDRTGMLIMLMQLLIGLSDAEIIDDYDRSNDALAGYHAERIKQKRQQRRRTVQDRRRNDVVVPDTTQHEAATSAAAAAMIAATRVVAPPRIKMDKRIFSGTNKAAMIATLEGLRCRRYNNTHHSADADASTTTTTTTTINTRTSIPFPYFDSIGFHASWRTRFRAVFQIQSQKKKKNNNNNTKGVMNNVTSIVQQRSRL